MRYKATRDVPLGGGHIVAEGQTVELSAGTHIPGLEPVLERVPSANALEHQSGERNLDAPGRGKVLKG
jgi:hypothetical protein